jgi:hypothetical protein
LIPDVRAAAVVAAVAGGAPVYVTAVVGHYDGDCPRPHTHDCSENALQVWSATTGELLRTVTDVGGEHLSPAVVDGRPVVAAGPWSDTPLLVDLDTGAVRDLAVRPDIVQGVVTVTLADGPSLVCVGWDGDIQVEHLVTGSVRRFATGQRLNATGRIGREAGHHLAGRRPRRRPDLRRSDGDLGQRERRAGFLRARGPAAVTPHPGRDHPGRSASAAAQ